MPGHFDILIRQAQLRGTSRAVDIGIEGGNITALAEQVGGEAELTIDAKANLVTESFVNSHLHLCKVYTRQMMDDQALTGYHAEGMGKAMTTIELAARVKEKYAEEWIIKNARRALAQAVLHGNTHLRAFADVDSKARLEGMKALIRARAEFKDILEIQVCAFAQDGLRREPGAGELMRQAMEMGADVAGGIPWIEYTEADIQSHVKEIFDLAQEFDRDVSMLVDDAGDPGLRSLEAMAVEAIRRVEGVVLPFPGGIARSGSKVGSRYSSLRASTNDPLCPTLRVQAPETQVPEGVGSVLEIIIDGLGPDPIRDAMAVGLEAAARAGAIRITAGNYGGELGPFHFHLRELVRRAGKG